MNSSTAIIHATTLELFTTVPPADHGHMPPVWGYIAVLVASVFFGSNLVPVKKFETGDGLFFQWILCTGIWLTGFVLNGIMNFPKFQPLAMLGGFLWSTGNIAVVPIIKTVGLSQGMPIWAIVNLLSGWACGRFGWFWIPEEIPKHAALNYVGVSLCLVSALVYMFLKTNTAPQRPQADETRPTSSAAESEVLLINLVSLTKGLESGVTPESEPKDTSVSAVNSQLADDSSTVFYEKWPQTVRRFVGIVLAVCAGTLFGLNFTPVIYVQKNYEGSSQNGLDYVFSHFCGILATSTLYLVIYCAMMRNRPRIYPQAILPGLISGVMWGIADIGWFVANDALSPIISFPIITSLPAIIGAMWGIFMFREIRGARNYVIFCSAVFLALGGSIMTALSRFDFGHDNGNVTTTPSY